MRLLTLAVCGVLISACSGGRGDVIKLTLVTAEERAETCYLVEVLDEAGTSRAASVTIPRVDPKLNYIVAIAHPGFENTISLRATALIGADCKTADKPNGVSALVKATFDPNRIVEATVSLTEGDVDHDGFVSTARGGGDCNDADDSVSPGAPEQCFGTVDHDCNGKSACSDPSCMGMACAGVPTRLAISDAPASIRVSECAGPVTVVVRDINNALTSPAQGATLMLSGPFTFFTDAMCSGAPTTGLTLESSQSVWLRATMPQVANVTVTSTGLESDTRSITVLPSGPSGIAFENPAIRVNAGGCSSGLIIALVDDAGSQTLADQPVTVSLSSDAGLPFNFFSDLACAQQVTSVQIAPDAGQVAVHYKGTVAGQFTVRAETSAPFVSAVEQPAVIDPGAAVMLSSSGPTVIAVGECGGPFVLTGRDQYGNALPVSNATATVPVDAGVTVFTSPACAMAGNPGSSYGVIASEEGQFTITLNSGAMMATQLVTSRKRGPAGSAYQWPLAVTTFARAPVRGYSGYTLAAAFDSRDAVDAGMLSASNSELRVFFWSDAGWSEVDRIIENPNSAATRVRFPSVTDLPNSSTDSRYAFFSGAFDGGAALARPGSVYLFADDFEAGNLSKWTVRGGLWQAANDRAHTGSGSLKYPTQTMAANQVIEAAPTLSEADVMFEAWWNTSDRTDTNFSQLIRLQSAAQLTDFETTLEDQAGWDIARHTSDIWSELSSNQGSVVNDNWVRINVSMSGSDMRVFRDGTQIVALLPVPGTIHPPGNVAFRKWRIGGALWVDDVTVRRYTEPEPSVSVGMPLPVPR